MEWDIEYTWEILNQGEQEEVGAVVSLLEKRGPQLPYPYSSGINSSKHNHMRELRIQHKGDPYRVLYAFDPRRFAILLLGGNKVGNEDWYDEKVPIADKLYDIHLKEIKKGT